MKNLTVKKWNFVQEGKITGRKVIKLADGSKSLEVGGSVHYTVVNDTIKKNRGIAQLDVYVKNGVVQVTQTRAKSGKVIPYNYLPVAYGKELVLHTLEHPVVVSKKVQTKVTKK